MQKMVVKKTLVSLYLDAETIKRAKLHCIEVGIKRVNSFYEQAIKEKLERDAEKK